MNKLNGWCETHRLAEVIGAPKPKIIIQQPTEAPILDILKQIMVQKAMKDGMPARNELALSSDWRITKSSVKAIDMANALQSLRRLAGGLGVKAEIIRYATDGESKSNKELIEIDTHYATQSQPIRDSEFDVLAGAMLHECGHYKIDSIDVPINYLDAKEGVYSPEGIGAIGEEIVADRYIQQKSKVYNRYIHAVRNAEKYNRWRYIRRGLRESSTYLARFYGLW